MAAPMTKLYRYPPSVAGGAVDPTAAQMVGHDRVVLDITTDAGGVNEQAVTVTHNLGLAVADGTDGTPEISFTPTTAGSVVCSPVIGFTSANAFTVTKSVTGANTAYVWRCVIKRPFSVGQ
jgi:hypothetical protein